MWPSRPGIRCRDQRFDDRRMLGCDVLLFARVVEDVIEPWRLGIDELPGRAIERHSDISGNDIVPCFASLRIATQRRPLTSSIEIVGDRIAMADRVQQGWQHVRDRHEAVMDAVLESTGPPDGGGHTAAALGNASLPPRQGTVVTRTVVYVRDKELESRDRHGTTEDADQEVCEFLDSWRHCISNESAVVTRKDHDRVLEHALALESGDHPPDFAIEHAHHSSVSAAFFVLDRRIFGDDLIRCFVRQMRCVEGDVEEGGSRLISLSENADDFVRD